MKSSQHPANREPSLVPSLPPKPPLSSLSSPVCQTSTPSDQPVSACPTPYVQHPPPFTLLPYPRCSSLHPPTSLPRSPSPRSALLRVRRPLCCFRSLAQQTDVLSLLPISLPSLSSHLLPVLLFLLLLFLLAVLPTRQPTLGTSDSPGDRRRPSQPPPSPPSPDPSCWLLRPRPLPLLLASPASWASESLSCRPSLPRSLLRRVLSSRTCFLRVR